MRKLIILLLSGLMLIACGITVYAGCPNSPWPEGTPTQPDNYTSPPPSPPQGGDANVKSVQVSKAGKEDFQHEIIVGPQEKIDLEVTADNKGDVEVNNCRFKYYHSEVGKKVFDIDPNNYVGDDDDLDMNPGQTITDHKQGIITPQTPGTYYYYLSISYSPDVNKGNNVSSTTNTDEYAKVTVLANNLSIVQAALIAPSVIYPNSILKLQISTKNNGADLKNEVHVGYYRSVGTTYNNPTKLGYGNIKPENFPSGAIKGEDWQFTAPAAGTYTISAFLDCDNAVPNESETDNWVHITFQVKQPPAPVPPPPPMSISVLEPKAGAKWATDKTYYVKWQAKNFPVKGNVDLTYSLDGGKTWKVLEKHVGNDGSRRWILKNFSIKNDSSNCYVKVTSCENPKISGTSGKFTIDHKKGYP